MTELEFQHYPIDIAHIPKSWNVSSISELEAEIQSGFPTGEHNNEGLGIPHIRPMNIDRHGEIDLSELKFVSPKINELRLRRGDVLFNNTNSPELIGKTAAITRCDDWAFSNHMTRLRFPQSVDFRFAAHQLHYLWMSRYFRHRCVNHVNQASISGKPLARSVPFLVAPLNEQFRIVNKIEELFSDLDTAVVALKRAKSNLKNYRAAVLKAAVEGKLTAEWRAKNPTEPASKLLERVLAERRRKWEADQLAKFTAAGKEPPKNWKAKYIEPKAPDTAELTELPDEWGWTALAQIASVNRGKFQHRPRNEPRFYGGNYPFVQIGDLPRDGGAITTFKQTLNDEGLRISRLFPKGTVLIAIVGATIANTGILSFESCAPDSLVAIQTAQESLGLFIDLYLRSRKLAIRRMAYASGGQPNINLETLLPLAVPLPMNGEVEAILQVVDQHLSVIDAAEAAIDHSLLRAARLRQSILKQAFEGTLVPQDDSDEPACELLDRLRTNCAGTRSTRKSTKRDNDTAPRRSPARTAATLK